MKKGKVNEENCDPIDPLLSKVHIRSEETSFLPFFADMFRLCAGGFPKTGLLGRADPVSVSVAQMPAALRRRI